MKHLFSPFNSQKETLRQGRFVFFGAEQPGGDWQYWDNEADQNKNEDLQGALEDRNINLGEKVQDLKNLRSNLVGEFLGKIKNFVSEDQEKAEKNKLHNKIGKLIADSVFGRGNRTPTMNQSLGRVDYRDVTEFNDYIVSLEQNIRSILVDENLNEVDDMDLATIRNKFENDAEDVSNRKANYSESQKEGLKKEISTNMTLEVQNLRTRIFNAYKNENMSQTEKNELWHRVTDLIEKSILEGVEGKDKNFDSDMDKGFDHSEFKLYIETINANVLAILNATKADGSRVTDKYASQPQEKDENKEDDEKTEEQKFAEDLLMVSAHLGIDKKVVALMEADVPLEEINNRVEIYRQLNTKIKYLDNGIGNDTLARWEEGFVREAQNALMSLDFNPETTIGTNIEQWDSPTKPNYHQMKRGYKGVEEITIQEYIARMTNDSDRAAQLTADDKMPEQENLTDEEIQKKEEKINRLQVLIDSFEEKYPEPEYKPYLLKASHYLQKGDVESAIAKIKTLVEKKGLSYYINVEKSAKSDAYLAKSLRKGLKNTNLAAHYQIKEVYMTGQEAFNQLSEEDLKALYKEAEKLSEEQNISIEEAMKRVEEKEKFAVKEGNEYSDKENEALGTVMDYAAQNIDLARDKAEQRYVQMVEALEKQGMSMELLDIFSQDREVIISSMQYEIALKGSLNKYLREDEGNVNNLPKVLQDYSSMTGIGGDWLNLSDENAKLATEIAIAVVTSIALAGAGLALSMAKFGLTARAGVAMIAQGRKLQQGGKIAQICGKALTKGGRVVNKLEKTKKVTRARNATNKAINRVKDGVKNSKVGKNFNRVKQTLSSTKTGEKIKEVRHIKLVHEAEHTAVHIVKHSLQFTAMQTLVRTGFNGGKFKSDYILNDLSGNGLFYGVVMSTGSILKTAKALGSALNNFGKTLSKSTEMQTFFKVSFDKTGRYGPAAMKAAMAAMILDTGAQAAKELQESLKEVSEAIKNYLSGVEEGIKQHIQETGEIPSMEKFKNHPLMADIMESEGGFDGYPAIQACTQGDEKKARILAGYIPPSEEETNPMFAAIDGPNTEESLAEGDSFAVEEEGSKITTRKNSPSPEQQQRITDFNENLAYYNTLNSQLKTLRDESSEYNEENLIRVLELENALKKEGLSQSQADKITGELQQIMAKQNEYKTKIEDKKQQVEEAEKGVEYFYKRINS